MSWLSYVSQNVEKIIFNDGQKIRPHLYLWEGGWRKGSGPGPGSGRQGQDHEKLRRRSAALQLQMVLALTLVLVLTLDLAQITTNPVH